MRFMPIGRPMRPSPIRPMCLAGEFKRDLLDDGLLAAGRLASRPCANRKEAIVADVGAENGKVKMENGRQSRKQKAESRKQKAEGNSKVEIRKSPHTSGQLTPYS